MRTRYATDQAVAASTIATLTDNSGGTAADTVAAITNANNAGSADVTPTANAIATLVREQAALRVELAAIRTKLGI